MWAKIDDGYYSNAKVLRVSGDARHLHLASMIWASAHSNGLGVVPKPALATLGVWTGLSSRAVASAAQLLADVGLWEDYGDDWLVHDFVPYTPPKRRADNAIRLQEWRDRKRHETSMKPGFTPVTGAVVTGREMRPVPVPVPRTEGLR